MEGGGGGGEWPHQSKLNSGELVICGSGGSSRERKRLFSVGCSITWWVDRITDIQLLISHH